MLLCQNTLKKFLSACKDTSSVAKTHAIIITSGVFNKFYVQLISSYARIGNIKFARKVFDKLPHRKIDAYNAIIVAYSRKGHHANEVVCLYRRMVLEAVKPDSSTFTVAIKACASLSDFETGEEIRVNAHELGYQKDLFFGSSLLNFYAKCGKMDEAMEVFSVMTKRDLVSWTTMVTGLAKCGRSLEAIGVYRMMREENMEGDEIVMLGLIQACCNVWDQKIGLSIHGYMIRKSIPMDVVVQTSLVDMYSKIGNLGLAYRVFEKIRDKTVVSFSALISGYAQNGFAMDALSLLRDMQFFGVDPDLASLVSSLSVVNLLLLVIFCVINLINYVDRGAIASNGVNGSLGSCTESGVCTSGTGIQGDFNLNNFEDGILSSAFMVGLLVASPIFASLAKRLIGVGLSVWTFAAAGCGVSFNFWSITICRMLVGVGEASFISLAAPFIDDNAPVAQKTAWLAIFYMCIPAGVAFGYVYGGLVGSYLSWRVAFFGEAILMLPFAVLGFVMKPLQLKGFSHSGVEKSSSATESALSEVKAGEGNLTSVKAELINEDSKKLSKSKFVLINPEHVSTFLKDVKMLLIDKVYLVNVLGYVAYNFVIGAYSYWGPKAGYNIYHMTDADLVFGGVTIICGIFGTIAGGLILDKMGNTIPNAFRLLSVATLLGTAFCFSAFCFKNMYAFLAFFAIGELLVFATQGPVNFISLHCVKPSMRPLSMAIGTVSIHIFGDVPSSPLVGVLQDYVNNWRETALILTSVLFLASGIWFIGVFLPSVDIFNEDSEPLNVETDSSSTIPLLHERNSETIDP